MLIRKIAKQLFDGISAGLLITIGCCVYLGCSEFKWVGAILFSVALLTICYKGYSLYTGKIGLLLDNLNKDYISGLLLGLLGNVIATAVVGIAVQYAIPNLQVTAFAMCQLKLDQAWWQTLIRGILCGVLMYVAVSIFKNKKNIVGILFAIPVFILSGFEHSIADMGYFAIAGVYSAKAFGFIWLVILGNSIGALILPVLGLVKTEVVTNNKSEHTELPSEEQDVNTVKDTENAVQNSAVTETAEQTLYTADTVSVSTEEKDE